MDLKKNMLRPSLFLFMLLAFSALLSASVYAGCCYGVGVSGCNELLTESVCIAIGDTEYTDISCSDLDECTTFGCCCLGNETSEPGQGVVAEAACPEPAYDFVPSGLGVICSEVCSGGEIIPPSQTYTLTGTVKDKDSGAAISNAEITLNAIIDGLPVTYLGTSAANGQYSITGISENIYTLFASKQNCILEDYITVNMDSNKVQQVNLKCTQQLLYSCTDWSDCNPVTNTKTRTCTPCNQPSSSCKAYSTPPAEVMSCGITPNSGFCNDSNLDDGEQCYYDPVTQTAVNGLCDALTMCIPVGMAGACTCIFDTECNNDGICDYSEDCDTCNDCSNSYRCFADACKEEKPDITLFNLDPDNDAARIEWTFDTGCADVAETFTIERCINNADCENISQNSPGYYYSNQKYLYTDSLTFDPNSTYCYKVYADFPDTESIFDEACSGTGNSECIKLHGEERFCYNASGPRKDSIAWCDSNDTLHHESCQPNGTLCFTEAGEPKCFTQPLCDKCNGILGVFSSVFTNRLLYFPEFDPEAGMIAYSCNELQDNYHVCYLDKSITGVSKYYDCSLIDSCYNYKSQATCTNDPCDRESSIGECEWLDYNTEADTGVCRPVTVERQDCSNCADPETNSIFSKCTPQICPLYGEVCYNYEGGRVPEGCIGTGTDVVMGCEYYENTNDCTGSTTLQVSNTTNIKDPESSDLFGFGTCRWADNVCIKDSDDDYSNDCSQFSGSDRKKCNADNTPPDTNINILNNNQCGLDMECVKYNPVDNTYAQKDLATSFYIGQCTEADCSSQYSNVHRLEYSSFMQAVALLKQNHVQSDQDTKYLLKWYSQDRAKNLEEIDEQELYIIGKFMISPILHTEERYTDENYGWLGRIRLNFTTSRTARCTGQLYHVTTHTMMPGIMDTEGQDFSVTYENLAGGIYNFNVTCTDEYATVEASSGNIALATDLRIYNVTPQGDTLNNNRPIIRLETSQPATSCRASRHYPDYENAELEMTKTDNTHFTLNLPSLTDGIYQYWTSCQLTDGTIVEGYYDDMAMFAIDTSTPTTTLWDVSGNNQKPFIVGKRQSVQLQFSCKDNPDLVDDSGYAWQYGCKEVHYVLTKGSNIIINEVSNYTTDYNPALSLNYLDSDVAGQTTLTYWSVDNGGNTESHKTVRLELVRTTGIEVFIRFAR